MSVKKILLTLGLVFLLSPLFAESSGSFHAAGAFGFSQIDGKSGNSLIFDLDYSMDNVSAGLRMHFPIPGDDSTKVPIFTLNFKFYPMGNTEGFFINAGFGILDDGKEDDSNTEEEEQAEILYLSGTIGMGFVFRANDNIAFLAGIDLSSAGTKTQVTNALCVYLGLMF